MARRLIATAHVLLEDRPRRRPSGSLEMHREHHSIPTTSPDTTRRRASPLDRAAKYYETIRPWCVSTREGLLARQIQPKGNGRPPPENVPASCRQRATTEVGSELWRRAKCPTLQLQSPLRVVGQIHHQTELSSHPHRPARSIAVEQL